MRLWITRAQPGAEETARRLRALGHQPLVAPLLEVRETGAPIDLDGVGALAFTSANGVRAFARRNERRDLPVFAVGDATAAVARAAGFQAVDSASGDISALAAHIAARRGVDGLVLHPGATHPAGDLIGDLARAGVPAKAVCVYETLAVAFLPGAVATALEDATLDGVVLHSPKAARTAARLLSRLPRQDGVVNLTAFALSPACLAPLDELTLKRRISADHPTEDDLMAAVAGS